MASNFQVRLGIVGMRLGLWHAGAIAEIEGAEIVAVADNVPGKLPGPNISLSEWASSLGADAYTDGVDMIQNADIDAVDLCVSPKWRLPLVEAAAARGLPVLLEKPWGTNMAHGQAIAEIIRQTQLLHMVEFPLRYFPPIVALKELLDDGAIGKPFVVNAEIVMGAAPAKTPEHWMWDPDNGNGAINENTCHVFDTLCYLLGDPVSLHAFGASYHGAAPNLPDGAVANIRFESGAVASVTGGALGANALRTPTWLDVYAEKGQALVTGIDHMYDTLTWGRFDDGEPTREHWPNPPLRTLIVRYALEEFVNSVRNGVQSESDASAGLKALALAMAVNESVAAGEPVDLSC
ncbi:MAG: Gfo/Idh/MocA family oxidoreductase [Chloroflexi bacterium]|nr:Gfo/Idh/MocA family oxidoreductase [Chloroflexota bacterium]